MIKVRKGHNPNSSRTALRVFICDVCGRELSTGSVTFLRRFPTLPEDTVVYHAHKECMGKFYNEHGIDWEKFSSPSAEASWMIPLVIGNPAFIEILKRPGHRNRSVCCN